MKLEKLFYEDYSTTESIVNSAAMCDLSCVEYLRSVQQMSRHIICEERKQLLQLLDGEVFYSLRLWPNAVKQIFWSKPTTDKDSFQVYLFLFGNGCVPEVARKWILSSQWWSAKEGSKRALQLQWMEAAIASSRYDNKWFYFDIEKKGYYFLNGSRKCE